MADACLNGRKLKILNVLDEFTRECLTIHLVAPETLPGLAGHRQVASERTAFAEQYPNIAFWIKKHGWIELGYDYNTDTCARAIDEGGMPWGGGEIDQTVDEWMQMLETGVKGCLDELGLR